MANIAWAGWQLPVPEDWRPLKIEGGHAKGSMMLGDARQPILLVQWVRIEEQARFDMERWLKQRFRKQGAEPEPGAPRPPGFAAAWTRDMALPEGGHKTVWYAFAEKARLLIELVTTDLTEAAVRDEVFARLVPRLSATSAAEPCRWTLYGISFASPPGYEMTRRRLWSGDITIETARGKKDRLLLRQVYPADLALARRTIDRWMDTPPFTERRFWRKKTAEPFARDGRIEGHTLRGWKRLRSPMGWFVPRFGTAVGAVDKELNRLLIAEHQADREQGMETVEWAIGKMNSGDL